MKVLDASVLMALLYGETGSEAITRFFLSDAVVSTVNLAEVQGSMVTRGVGPDEAWQQSGSYIQSIEPFTPAQAKLAGSLIVQTRSRGLSLGDRACLALAITLNAPVYTADQAWRDLDIGCQIHVIR
jgi:PIN domain nuclease of toxin-antitoxin system